MNSSLHYSIIILTIFIVNITLLKCFILDGRKNSFCLNGNDKLNILNKRLIFSSNPGISDGLDEFDNSGNPKWDPLSKVGMISNHKDRFWAEALIGRVKNIFTMLSSDDKNQLRVTKELLADWEIEIRNLASDIRKQDGSKEVTISVYKQLLISASAVTLDPLHYSTFDLISHAVIDNLLKNYSKNMPVTDLVDDISDVHLDFIEPFRFIIDDGGSDGYSQSSRQEFLCYQYAGLAKRVFSYLTKNLGNDFDNSRGTQELRLTNWVSPIYARLQRRFVRFAASNVDEKIEEYLQQAFDRLLLSVTMDIVPRYYITSLQQTSVTSSSLKIRDNYPAWDQADTIIKLLRNTVAELSTEDLIDLSIESKLLRTSQNEIANRMRPICKTLENMINKPIDKLQDREIKSVEEMLNIGHSMVAATFALWHVKHNIVGVPDKEGKYVKDFLQPVILSHLSTSTGSLASTSNALKSTLPLQIDEEDSITRMKDLSYIYDTIPQYLRFDVKSTVSEIINELTSKNNSTQKLAAIKLTDYLEAASILGNAIRITVSENLRALIIFNSDQSDWPQSRDACYQAVLSLFLIDSLLLPDAINTADSKSTDVNTFSIKVFYQNLIAMTALEEGIAVREPRLACVEAFKIALKNTALLLVKSSSAPQLNVNHLINRVLIIQNSLEMILRMPIGIGKNLRFQVFKDTIAAILKEFDNNQGGGMKEIDRVYKVIALFLGIDDAIAKSYITPLAQGKFDKAVGSILLNADLAVSMPTSMGDSFKQQIYNLADQVSIPRADADKRVAYLSGAVFESLMETSLEESRRFNYDRVEILFKKAYNMYKHPLLIAIDQNMSENGTSERLKRKSLLGVGAEMVYARLGKNLTIELLRLVENIRQKISSELSGAAGSPSSQGWGSSTSTGLMQQKADPEYVSFLTTLQQELLQEYTTASIGKGL